MKFKQSIFIMCTVLLVLILIGCNEFYQPPKGKIINILPSSLVNRAGFTKYIVEISTDIPICTAFNETVTQGGFILGCGTIDGTEYIFTFIKVGNAYKRKRIKIDGLYIIETDEISPRYIKVIYGSVKTKNEKLREETFERHCFIIVPMNTIIKKFEIR